MAGDDLSHSGSVEAVVLRSRRFYVPDSPELFSKAFFKLLMAAPLRSRITSIIWQWNCPMGLAANVRDRRCSFMYDTVQRNRWQELAEKASVEDNPARLMKLVDELLAELNRLKEKMRDSTRGSV